MGIAEIIAAIEAGSAIVSGLMRMAGASGQLTDEQLAELRAKVRAAADGSDAKWDEAVAAAKSRIG